MQSSKFSDIILRNLCVCLPEGHSGAEIQESVIDLKYDFTAIEKKWQSRWKEEKTFACQNGDTSKPKFYGLVEFPYPPPPACMWAIPGPTPPWT